MNLFIRNGTVLFFKYFSNILEIPDYWKIQVLHNFLRTARAPYNIQPLYTVTSHRLFETDFRETIHLAKCSPVCCNCKLLYTDIYIHKHIRRIHDAVPYISAGRSGSLMVKHAQCDRSCHVGGFVCILNNLRVCRSRYIVSYILYVYI